MKKMLTIFTALFALQVSAQDLTYQAGSLPEPAKIEKVLSAGNPSDVLLLAVAPEKLAGFAGFKMESKAGALFGGRLKNYPHSVKLQEKAVRFLQKKSLR